MVSLTNLVTRRQADHTRSSSRELRRHRERVASVVLSTTARPCRIPSTMVRLAKALTCPMRQGVSCFPGGTGKKMDNRGNRTHGGPAPQQLFITYHFSGLRRPSLLRRATLRFMPPMRCIRASNVSWTSNSEHLAPASSGPQLRTFRGPRAQDQLVDYGVLWVACETRVGDGMSAR